MLRLPGYAVHQICRARVVCATSNGPHGADQEGGPGTRPGWRLPIVRCPGRDGLSCIDLRLTTCFFRNGRADDSDSPEVSEPASWPILFSQHVEAQVCRPGLGAELLCDRGDRVRGRGARPGTAPRAGSPHQAPGPSWPGPRRYGSGDEDQAWEAGKSRHESVRRGHPAETGDVDCRTADWRIPAPCSKVESALPPPTGVLS